MSAEAHSEHLHAPPTSFYRKYVWSTDHKTIAKQYLFTAFFFLLLGGGLAMLFRWQLAYPNQPFPILGKLLRSSFVFASDGSVTPDGYNQLVTMHGTIMIFFVIIPILVGAFGNFLIPLHIGARDVAFPILNALSYWLFLPAGLILFASFFLREGPAAAGWTAYPPLSDLAGAAPGSGTGQVLWLFAILLLGFSSILGGLNFLTTIIKMRAPGLTWSRLPLITWAQFVTAIFQTLATPILASATVMMLADKLLGTTLFLPKGIFLGSDLSAPTTAVGGGHPLVWQHVFWFYSHPAVYILVLPGMGIASDLIATFARKPIFGYTAMAASLVGIMGLGYIVWGHHMFVSGMSPVMGMAFMTSTMLIALPSGVKVFNWLGTLWNSSIRFTVPMLHALSFVSLFIIGGLSGLFMAATPVDIYIHDTYYIVAHFHYVVFGGTLFAVFGGLTFWFPKMFGREMNKKWGFVHWLLTFVGFNAAFFPMHFLGEAGHIRRVATITEYEFGGVLQPMNVWITWSAFLLGAAQLIFLANFFASAFKGKRSEANPWKSNTLEWTTPSPVPFHNFDRIPTVYRGPYEYSSAEADGRGDWAPQDAPPDGRGHRAGH
ncbi:MAG TPA: cbb3-type cytochrome c oxidase subunit I [Planctomycetota bacterium]|jgi:cytochrome c oxidase subunit 1|nr:cbb3-type cytochrome c oxidase subunit I [Planctomycetota bacterium]